MNNWEDVIYHATLLLRELVDIEEIELANKCLLLIGNIIDNKESEIKQQMDALKKEK